MQKGLGYTALLASLLLLAACRSGDSPAGTLATAGAGGAAGAGTAMPDTGQATAPAQVGTSPTVAADTEASAAPGDDGIVVLADLAKWDHPIKQVFAAHKVELRQVSWKDQKRFPIFDIVLPYPFDPAHQADFRKLAEDLAKANAYWNYELRDAQRKLDLVIHCDKSKKRVVTLESDGETLAVYPEPEETPGKDSMTADASGEDIPTEDFDKFLSGVKRGTLKLPVWTAGDLDGDGQAESIVKYGDRNYAVKTMPDGYRNLGELADAIGVYHDNSDIRMQALDRTGEKYIVVYSDMPAVGFTIYHLERGKVALVMFNYPTATNSGQRLLEDRDQDGLFESISVYRYPDLQQHVITSSSPFDQPDNLTWQVEYGNDQGVFVYPSKPEEVVRNYIEDVYNQDDLGEEMMQLAPSAEVRKYPIGDHFDLSGLSYYGLDLTYVTVKTSPQKRLISAEGSSDEGKLFFTLEPNSSGQWIITGISDKQPK